MKLFQIIAALKDEVVSERGIRLFETAKAQHPALADHASVASLIRLLGQDDPSTYSVKEAAIRVILAKHRRGKERFWSSLLIVVFGPMLCRLRGRVLADGYDCDDLDQMVLFAFLLSAKKVRLNDGRGRLCMYLRQVTQRRVFTWLKEEQRRAETVAFIEPVVLSENAPAVWPVPGMIKRTRARRLKHDDDEAHALAELLREKAGEVVAPDKLELVIATAIQGESMRGYVRRHHGDLDQEGIKRAYQRIKKQRNRTVAQLRAVLY